MKSFGLMILLIVMTLPTPVFAQPHFQKVLTIVFENTDYKKVIDQPYFSQLINKGAVLENFHAVTHPSQGNYVALTSGSLHGVKDDKNVELDVTNIADLIENQGRTWKAYAEDFPGNCFLGKSKGSYARKHLPFISYTNIQTNPTRCARIQNAMAFEEDVKNDSLPDYMFYVPNLKSDGHDTGVNYADKWFKSTFSKLLENENFMQDLLVIVTFDEGSSTPDNHIFTLLLGSGIQPGASSQQRYDHYSLLRLIEDEWSLGSLELSDKSAQQIDDVWN